MPRATLIPIAVALFAAACSSATNATGSGATVQQSVGIHDVLTDADLANAKDRTLYDAMQRLRPSFLRSRQVRSPSTPVPEPVHVYIDGSRTEGLEALKLLTPSAVKEVRFYE